MNPQGMTIGPELAAALMRRRMGGMGGGNTAPAGQQVMAPNPMGGPLGASQTPLPTSPQPLQAGNLMPPSQDSQAAVMQQMMAQGGGQPQGQASPNPASGSGSSGGSDPKKSLMKALLQNLVADL
jgi:hypothetical protein